MENRSVFPYLFASNSYYHEYPLINNYLSLSIILKQNQFVLNQMQKQKSSMVELQKLKFLYEGFLMNDDQKQGKKSKQTENNITHYSDFINVACLGPKNVGKSIFVDFMVGNEKLLNRIDKKQKKKANLEEDQKNHKGEENENKDNEKQLNRNVGENKNLKKINIEDQNENEILNEKEKETDEQQSDNDEEQEPEQEEECKNDIQPSPQKLGKLCFWKIPAIATKWNSPNFISLLKGMDLILIFFSSFKQFESLIKMKWIHYVSHLKKPFLVILSKTDENEWNAKTIADTKSQIIELIQNIEGYNGYYTISILNQSNDTNALIDSLTDLNLEPKKTKKSKLKKMKKVEKCSEGNESDDFELIEED